MPRVKPIEFEEASAESQALWEDQIASNGRMTNMKKTLARSPKALDAYMKWYELKDRVQEFLGSRLTILFAMAISSETDCVICSTYFRRYFIESGENPDEFEFTEKERQLMAFGRQIAKGQHRIDDETYRAIESKLEPGQIVTLVAFAGLMVATNIINNVLEVQLDEDFSHALDGDLERALLSFEKALQIRKDLGLYPDDWTEYITATIAYLKGDLELLKLKSQSIHNNNHTIHRLIDGLKEFGTPNYARDYSC